ncbi:MAG: Flp pilus assembly protein CpaB [Actinomycetia bacterium]|nr:Flp pilus assembly protein CpaB [Actinomycetes bacterium]
MGRRTLLLIAALVVAALGTVLIFLYVNNLEEEAIGAAEPVDVLVATQQVAPGTTAADASNDGAFEIATVPASAAPVGVLSDITLISDQVALAPIFPGQQVLAQMFGPPGSSASGLSVPKDKLAMSVQLGDPERVAGFVAPGSDVTIFWTDDAGDTMVIIPKLNVLGTGATTLATQVTTTDTGESTTSEIPQAILTLETDQVQAQRIINAQANGALYFGLLGDGTQTRTGLITTPTDLRR